MKYSIILTGMVIAVLSTGCMSGYYAHREHRRVVQEDTLMTPPMTVDDVIAMAKDGVGDDVILAQMKATHSAYRLTSNDIRDLKKNGVSDKVINAMIKSVDEPKVVATKVVQPYPDYYYWNPYPYPYFYYSPYPYYRYHRYHPHHRYKGYPYQYHRR
jgi:hypothetical protein